MADTLQYSRYYNSALYKAKKESKPLMVMVALRGCPACEHMENFVFLKDEVITYMNKNFISVIMHRGEDSIPLKFDTPDSPTFFFLNPFTKKEMGDRFIGGKSPEKFLKIVKDRTELFHNILKENNKTQTKIK
jgi:hypothetical protein